MAKTITQIKNILEKKIDELQQNQKKFTGIKKSTPMHCGSYTSSFEAGRNFGQMEGIGDALSFIDELLHDPDQVQPMNAITISVDRPENA